MTPLPSRGPEEKPETEDVERAQVASRWTRAMVKYGIEARGSPSFGQRRVSVLNRGLQVSSPSLQSVEQIPSTARYSSSGSLSISISSRPSFVSCLLDTLIIDHPSFRFSAGTLGPAVFGLGLRDSCLVILFFNLICAAMPSYL